MHFDKDARVLFTVSSPGEHRPVFLKFGSRADVRRILRWRTPHSDDGPVLDAMEFRKVATKRWRYYEQAKEAALSVEELRAAIDAEPFAEIGFLLVALASRGRANNVPGCCFCRRSWSHHLVLDFLAVHPKVVADREPRGVGTGIDAEAMRSRPRQLGFVDVRVMAGMVILFILIAVAIPNFVKARTTRSMDSRLEYAMWIEAAKQVWAAENNKVGSAVPAIEELKPYLQRIRSHPDSRLGPRPLPVASIGADRTVRIAEWEFSLGSVTQRVAGGSPWDEPYFHERYAKIIATWPRAKKRE